MLFSSGGTGGAANCDVVKKASDYSGKERIYVLSEDMSERSVLLIQMR